jgi:hypothetical protein
MANISLKSLLVEVSNPKLEKIVKQTLGSKVRLHHFKDKMWLVAPGDFYSPVRLRQMASDLLDAIPSEMLAEPVGDLKPVKVGAGGASEGQIIIKLK